MLRFYLAGADAGQRQLTGIYSRRRGQEFMLQSAKVDGKSMPSSDFELLTDIGKQWRSNEQMLPYAFGGLKSIASSRCKDTPERRALLELLGKA